MNRYEEGKIYRIYCFSTDREYIGSTCLTLNKRLKKHLKNYRRWKRGNKKGYMTSFEIFELENYDVELIENFPCDNRKQLWEREAYYINHSDNCVNEILPYVPEEERKARKKEYNNNYNKLYGAKKYTCICGRTIRKDGKYKHIKTALHKNGVNKL